MADQFPERLQAGTQVNPVGLATPREPACRRASPEQAETSQHAAAGRCVGEIRESEAGGRHFSLKGGELRPRVAGDDVAGEVESPDVARHLAAAKREGGKITLHVHPEHAAAVHRRTLEDVDRLDALVDVVGDELEFGRAERGRLGNRPEQHVHVGALDRRFALWPRGVGKAEPARGAVNGVQLLPYSGAAGCRQQVADANVPGRRTALHAAGCSVQLRGAAVLRGSSNSERVSRYSCASVSRHSWIAPTRCRSLRATGSVISRNSGSSPCTMRSACL